MSWENLLMPYVNNKGADQPAHGNAAISFPPEKGWRGEAEGVGITPG